MDKRFTALALVILAFVLGSCASPQATPTALMVHVVADNQRYQVQLPAGSTVQQALSAAALSLQPLDRVEPAVYTLLTNGAEIRVIRVKESFEVVRETIPFERQVVYNESLPQDQEVLLQRGKNGIQEVTYRQVFEDGVKVSSLPVPTKLTIIEEPVAEIVMVGIQSPFIPINFPGRLVYLRDGNIWVMEGSTANRRAVVTTGDVDGRIFTLSTDGSWLLFTRKSKESGVINTLWAIDLGTENPELVNLSVENIVHFADFLPSSTTKIVFSTVEPREAPPGWQANNDLNTLTFSDTGWTTKWTVVLEPNSGGIYGWWGTEFVWSPTSKYFAFAQPDSIGFLDYETGQTTEAVELLPYQTGADWAWVPGFCWGGDGQTLYFVSHISPPGAAAPEESQEFDLSAFSLLTGHQIQLASQVGMFAYPMASPLVVEDSGEIDYQVAYLQAVFPNQSETSRYRLALMDRDGSNRRMLFPPEGKIGMEPLKNWGAWSPQKMAETQSYILAVIYQGNLFFVDAATGQAQQITGDGLTSRVAWK